MILYKARDLEATVFVDILVFLMFINRSLFPGFNLVPLIVGFECYYFM